MILGKIKINENRSSIMHDVYLTTALVHYS
jgi:hypothetical protein